MNKKIEVQEVVNIVVGIAIIGIAAYQIWRLKNPKAITEVWQLDPEWLAEYLEKHAPKS